MLPWLPIKTLNVRDVKALPTVGEFADADLVATIVDEVGADCPIGGTRIEAAN
jgi:hypothetical protein